MRNKQFRQQTRRMICSTLQKKLHKCWCESERVGACWGGEWWRMQHSWAQSNQPSGWTLPRDSLRATFGSYEGRAWGLCCLRCNFPWTDPRPALCLRRAIQMQSPRKPPQRVNPPLGDPPPYLIEIHIRLLPIN